MRKIGLIVGGLLLIVGVIMYSYLGGFSEPVITIEETAPFSVYGYSYEGQLGNREFGKLFRVADSLVDNAVLKGVVAGVFYNQPSRQEDTVKTFVGVLAADTVAATGIERRDYRPGRVIQATIEAHYLVMPVNIYPKIMEFAKENNIELSGQSFEIYERKDFLKIRMPVQEALNK